MSSFLRHKTLLFACLALLAVSAVGLAVTCQPSLVQARATIELIAPAGELPAQLHLLESETLVRKAASLAGVKQPRVVVSHNPASHQVALDVFADEKPAAVANALVQAYKEELAQSEAARQAAVAAQLGTLLTALQQSEAALASTIEPLKKEALAQEIATRRQVYRSMLESSQESRNAQTSVKVIEPASESAASANPWTGLAIGLPTTLFGGFLFFFSRKRARELSAAVAHAEVVPETAPKSTEAPTANQIIAVTNMAAGFTHPEILHDFIESLMTLDSRMLVIDCEIGGAFTTAVGLKGAPGLSDFLEQPPSERPMLPVWKSTRDGVLIMPAGTKPHRIPGLLSRHAATSEAIGYLRNGGFAHIVINAPSILTAGEMRHLTPLVDGLVLVTPSENSKDLPQAAVRQVEEYGGRILGVIADAPAAKHAQAA